MAASERAYTSEYSYIGQPYRPAQSYGQQGTYRAYPQPRPERPQVRRSEERLKLQVQPQVQQEMQPVITHRMLLRVITACLCRRCIDQYNLDEREGDRNQIRNQ